MEKPISVLLITQARFGSTRLPGKVLLKIEGKELLRIHTDRLKQSKLVDKIIIATTIKTEDQAIVDLAEAIGVSVFKGSEDDVLDRFYQASKDIKPVWVVRVTSDCPLIDPALLDAVISFAIASDVDYCSNTLIENFPDGQDIEVMKFSVLERAWKEATLKSDKEHVTPFIRKNCDFNGGNYFTSKNYPCEFDYSKIRMTVDEQADLDLITKLIANLGVDCSWQIYVKYILEKGLTKINETIIRNEGYLKSLKKD